MHYKIYKICLSLYLSVFLLTTTFIGKIIVIHLPVFSQNEHVCGFVHRVEFDLTKWVIARRPTKCLSAADCGCEWKSVATKFDQLSRPRPPWISPTPAVPRATGGLRRAGVAFTRLVYLGPRPRNGIPQRCLVASRYQTNCTLQAPLIPQADLQNEFYMVVSERSENRSVILGGKLYLRGIRYIADTWTCHFI